jgi:hypothetical protein
MLKMLHNTLYINYNISNCTNSVYFVCLWLIPHPTAILENFWIHEMNELINERIN